MVQIVELGYRGISALQHAGIEITRNSLQLVRVQLRVGTVHKVTPAPEVILSGNPVLGQSRNRFLMGVGVQIGQSRDDDAI